MRCGRIGGTIAVVLARIVSGGQTGVDRGALDAALARGFPCGGWCPAGRLAEDGAIPERYPVTVLPGAGYAERTLRNVVDSDATLIVCFGRPTGGTALTIRHAEARGKPCLIVDAAETSAPRAAQRVRDFVDEHDVATLNVAGPRASGDARAHGYALELLSRVLENLSGAR